MTLIPIVVFLIQVFFLIFPPSDDPIVNAAFNGGFLGAGIVGLIMLILHHIEVIKIQRQNREALQKLGESLRAWAAQARGERP